MPDEKAKRFRQSFTRCLRHPEFTRRFYENLVNRHPDVAPLFAHTEMGALAAMLNRTLMLAATATASNGEIVQSHLTALGRYHTQQGVSAEHYTLWIDTLIDTAAEFDPYFDDDVAALWHEMMKRVMQAMIKSE